MLSEKRLAEIQARSDAATEGPWEWGGYYNDGEIDRLAGRYDADGRIEETILIDGRISGERVSFIDVESADADFIAHSREDIPDLLEEIVRLKGELQSALTLWEEMGRAL